MQPCMPRFRRIDPRFGDSLALTADKLYEDVLDVLFEYLPFRDALSCAGVCRRWREIISHSRRWRSFQVGLNFQWHADAPISDCVFLPTIEEVKFTLSEYGFESHCQDVPMELLRFILARCTKLCELDLFQMQLPVGISRRGEFEFPLRESEAHALTSFESLWISGQVVLDQLKSLALPSHYPPSIEFLEAIFKAHPSLEKLSLPTDVFKSTPGCDRLFANHKSLAHLTFRYTRPSRNLHEILGDSDNSKLTSLHIIGLLCAENVFFTSLGNTYNFTRLHFDVMSYGGVELLFHACPKLESLKIDRIEAKLNEDGTLPVRCLVEDISQRLSYVDLGIENHPGRRYFNGLRRLLQILDVCASLKDLSISPYYILVNYGEYPTIPELELASRPRLWSKITSLFIKASSVAGWYEFKTLLPKMNRLKKLCLQVAVNVSSVVHDDVAHALESLHIWLYRADYFLGLRNVLRLWHSVTSFSIQLSRIFNEQSRLNFNILLAFIPSIWQLRQVDVSSLQFWIDLPPSMGLESLRFVTHLSLGSEHKFADGVFRNFVACLPFIEVFSFGPHLDVFKDIHISHNLVPR